MKGNFLEEKHDEKRLERIPAPRPSMTAAKKRGSIRWWHVAIAIFLTLTSFLVGYVVCWNSFDPQIHTLKNVKEKIQSDYYKEVSDEDFYDAVFDGINNTLLDRYSGYMSTEDFLDTVVDLYGLRTGLGVGFSGTNSLRIAKVCGNSPAEAAGLVVGETILGIGDTEATIAPCAQFEAFSTLLAEYEEGEEFYLQVQATDGGTRVISIAKAKFMENYVFYRTKDSAYACVGDDADKLVPKGEPLPCLDEDTAYIRLVEFIGDSEKQFQLAMDQFKKDGKKNLVLDLRGNGGGFLDSMQSISKYFCKNAEEEFPVVAVADYGERKESFTSFGNVYDEYFAEDSRICVLADSGTASASECLIGAMVDYGAVAYSDICLSERGGVAKTYGKGIMQETYIINYLQLNALKLTTAEIKWPLSGISIHGCGVLPSDGALTVQENSDFEAETVAAIQVLFG